MKIELTPRVRIINKMVAECWEDLGKSPLTTRQLREDLDWTRLYFFTKLHALDRKEFLDLCFDYLWIHGYKVGPIEDISGFRCASLLSMMPDSVEVHGLAIFALEQEEWLELTRTLSQQPGYGFFIVFVPSAAEVSGMQPGRNIRVVSRDDLFRTFVGIILHEYFSLYFYTITQMPGFKERMFKIIEEKIGLLWDDLQKLHKEWVKLVGKY